MGNRLSANLHTDSPTRQTKKRSKPSHNTRLSPNQLLKKNSSTPPESPYSSYVERSTISIDIDSQTDTFNYVDNLQPSEADRSHVNHFALKVLFEGNVLSSIANNLDLNSSEIRILDVGCGPGTWLFDMATEYPNTQFFGIDQVVTYPQDIRPSNIHFSVQDILEGLSFEDNSFDFVYLRLFCMTFDRTFWKVALKEILRVLKPGGYIQLLEGQYMDSGDELVRNYNQKVLALLDSNDQDGYICDNLEALLSDNGFTPIEFVRKSVPLNTHLLRTEMLYVIKLSMDSCKPFIYKMCNFKTDQEYIDFQTEYLRHRTETSESVWTACSGFKPLA